MQSDSDAADADCTAGLLRVLMTTGTTAMAYRTSPPYNTKTDC